MNDIDVEVLISLVEARPVLWDKTLDVYKDRNATKNAWREVCSTLKEDFDLMEDKDKNAFGKDIIRRWTNLRDCFVKSNTKMKATKRSGSAAKKFKKYVYADQLQFIKKLYEARKTQDSLQPENATELEEYTETQVSKETIENAFDTPSTRLLPKRVRPTNSRKQRKPDEIEIKMLRALETEKPCSKTSFLLSLKPHLDKFDEQDYLQFQLGVLRVIENINNRKKAMLATPPTFIQHTPSMPYDQFHTNSHLHSTKSAPIQVHPPPATPNPGFFPSREGFNNPNVFSASQLQTTQSHSSHQQGNEGPPPHSSPSTSNNERAPSTTQFYQQFGETICSQSDNSVSPMYSLPSTSDSINFSSP